MAYKAPKNEGVQRVVTGPKSVWIPTESGGRRLAEIGETITVSQKTANTFKDRLKDVAVAEAEAVVAKAEAIAAGGIDEDEEGDS
jgi:hypothetical protein